MESLDLSLYSTQGTRILLLKHILVVKRRDYWTFIYLLKDLIILLKKNVMHYTNSEMAPTIIIKGADNGSAVVVWDREDYLKEASKQLEDKDVYEEVQNDPSTFINTTMHALEKIRI